MIEESTNEPTFVPDPWSWNTNFKSDKIKIYGHQHRTVCFHPSWSNGTAGVRGDKILNRGHSAKHYWEIKLPNRIFGTSMMFGIGTNKCRLQAPFFVNIIGENNQGWGLSHKGLLWHNGRWKRYTKPFRQNESTTIGILFDSHKGTLTYFKDGVNLGVAFKGLDKVKNELYPMVSSTAAKTEMVLNGMKKACYNFNLQERCRDVIRRKINDITQLNQLKLPLYLRKFLTEGIDSQDNMVNNNEFDAADSESELSYLSSEESCCPMSELPMRLPTYLQL